MIPVETLLALALASVVIIAMPGPSVLFVIGRSIALGRRAGLLRVLGNTLGTLPAVVAVSLGVGQSSRPRRCPRPDRITEPSSVGVTSWVTPPSSR